MNDAEREEFLNTCKYAIAVCKEEVEKVLPLDIMHELDAGSPWGRALMRMHRESREQPIAIMSTFPMKSDDVDEMGPDR
jgi:hypothetical protein